MEMMKDYNQFSRTSNPIKVKSSFINTIPCERIEVRTRVGVDGVKELEIGKYQGDN